jgi:hypothetical protein
MAVVLEEVRKRAERERHEDNRLVWAKRAVDVALLSSSVGLLGGVVTWTRRFLRDPVRFISSVICIAI